MRASFGALLAGLAAALAAPAPGALAQSGEALTIKQIRAQAFLEKSGRLSEDLLALKAPPKNLARPTSTLGEPADALLVTLTFSGPKNTVASRNLARDMAQVTVKQRPAGQAERTLLIRAVGGFAFGPDGLAHRALMLDDATCAPLTIEVKLGRSRGEEKLDLACDPLPDAASEAGAKKDSRKGKR